MKYIAEAAFILLIFLIARYQASQFNKGLSISHWLWALIFGAIMAGCWLAGDRGIWFAVALILEHFIFFAPILNYLRVDRKLFFYVHSGKGGSWFDEIMLDLGGAYPVIWIASVALFIFLQFFL